MGSKSDWDAMKAASDMLTKFGVAHECRVMSAHRTPAVVAEYASGATSRGMEVIIAGAGGAAHLAGIVAAHTVVPVVGVFPVEPEPPVEPVDPPEEVPEVGVVVPPVVPVPPDDPEPEPDGVPEEGVVPPLC